MNKNTHDNNADGKENVLLDNSHQSPVSLFRNPGKVKSSSNKNGVRLQKLLDLFEANMGEQHPTSSWGLNMNEKNVELSHDKARFLALLDTNAHQKVGNDNTRVLRISLAARIGEAGHEP